MSDVWYFAYGSNMCREQKEERTDAIRTGADGPRIARLANYLLAFNKPSVKWGAAANIIPCPGAEVIGVVYRCDLTAMEIMDDCERGYDRMTVNVVLGSGDLVQAITYIAVKNLITNRGPAPSYLEKIIRGATQHGLPDEYISRIQLLAQEAEGTP